ncbi:MAG: hypothetical protein AUK37_06930 [Rhodobacterales bacterium CG2_30_65_12]|nr:MAG: hypothetical protein AUK37_06930 [Rhodobacterales bacterium CG2_30_65_12]
MKTILVATDLSERSDRAVRRAIWLAGQLGASCHAIHVVDDSLPEQLVEYLREETGIRLRRFIDVNKGNVDVTTEILVGDATEAIPEQAKAHNADLVVLGLHRPRAILDNLRETTMERLVRLTRKPILLVREPADHAYSSVLAPISFSPACAAAVRAARMIAPEARMTMVHAVYLPFRGLTGERPGGVMDRELTAEARDVCARWCATEALPANRDAVIYESGGLNEVIDRERQMVNADLVALGAHTRGPIALHALGGFAASLVRHPPTDLLLAHP